MKVVVTVVCQDGERHLYEHMGNVDTLRTLLNQLKVRHNPRMIEAHNLKNHKTRTWYL